MTLGRSLPLAAPLAALALLVAPMTAAPAAAPDTAAAGSAQAAAASSTQARRGVLMPADGVYRARVRVTKRGIPHITARDYGSLGFGQGWVTAQSSGCTLADTVLTARGHRSRVFGAGKRYNDQVTLNASNLQVDALVTDLRNRRIVEKLLRDRRRGPSAQAKAMVRGYVAGANRFLYRIGGWANYSDRACRNIDGLPTKIAPIDLWYGVYLANLLGSTGVFVPQIVDATPPVSSGSLGSFQSAPTSVPARDALLAGLGKDPEAAFGSNATAVGSDVTTTRRGMVLGNPHFPWIGRYRFTQAQLTIPGEYDVSGGMLIGSPVVNIGWNRNVAWSHTVSTAYRFTPYEYRTAGTSTSYLTDGGPKDLERRVVKVVAKKPGGGFRTITEDLYRTPQGYVMDAPDVLMPWTPTSFFAIRDANAEHLRTIDTFLAMGKARTVRGLLAAQDRQGGMPWVNTTAADRRGTVLYADHSVVPNVPDDLVAECNTPTGQVLFNLAGLPALDGTRADGDCAWRTDADASRPGMFGPGNLPETYRKDWVINANDSYWLPNPKQRLEGYARIIGCERCERTLRTRVVYRYVLDRLAGRDGLARHRKVSPLTLRRSEHVNRVFGGEVTKAGGDLVAVCESAGGGTACDVLAKWDGRSNRASVGTHIFEEFWRRAQDVSGLWQVPFSADDPVGTPRDLNESNPQVIQAMSDALGYLEEQGIAYDAPWGRIHVAADRGAPPIGLGGGEGFSGNANALKAVVRKGKYRVIYGSSHIQSVAFIGRRGVDARTILTYGQSMDPSSLYSSDQTRMFARKRWVRFPTTPRQIRRQLVRAFTVTGRV